MQDAFPRKTMQDARLSESFPGGWVRQALMILLPVPCRALGHRAPWVPWKESTAPQEGGESRAPHQASVTLPPGHSSSSVYPLQCLTPYLNLESCQDSQDGKVWMIEEEPNTQLHLPGLWVQSSSGKTNTGRGLHSWQGNHHCSAIN